jgi:hypothetical protein
MKRLSIVRRDYRNAEHAVGYYNTGDPFEVLGKARSFLRRDVGPPSRVGILADAGSEQSTALTNHADGGHPWARR